MQYFAVMIDYGRRGREAIVDPEITRREVISRIVSGEYANISFIHEIMDDAVEDVTEDILWLRCPTSRPQAQISRPRASIMSGICTSTSPCEIRWLANSSRPVETGDRSLLLRLGAAARSC